MREKTYLTLGQVARALKVQTWQVGRLYERGILPEPPRVGLLRVVPQDELDVIREALRSVGYLPVESEVAGV